MQHYDTRALLAPHNGLAHAGAKRCVGNTGRIGQRVADGCSHGAAKLVASEHGHRQRGLCGGFMQWYGHQDVFHGVVLRDGICGSHSQRKRYDTFHCRLLKVNYGCLVQEKHGGPRADRVKFEEEGTTDWEAQGASDRTCHSGTARAKVTAGESPSG